jgi:hypothetical protein
MKTENEKSPFSLYQQGYLDGYEGRDMELPDDVGYVWGWKEGQEDDLMAKPNKYA